MNVSLANLVWKPQSHACETDASLYRLFVGVVEALLEDTSTA